MGTVSAGLRSADGIRPLLWTIGGWVTAAWVVSVMADWEKEAILCKIEPTLSLASPVPSSNDRMVLGLEGLSGLIGLSWAAWGLERIPSLGL